MRLREARWGGGAVTSDAGSEWGRSEVERMYRQTKKAMRMDAEHEKET